MQCTGTSKQSGKQCKRHAKVGMTVCKIHGGDSLAGIASPTFKDGTYSKVMPTQLMRHYEEAQNNPDLIGVRHNIELQDALIRSTLDSMSRGESGELWATLHSAWRYFQKAKTDPTKDEMEAERMVGYLINEGYTEQQSRNEIRGLLQEHAKLVETEGKRLERAQQTITSAQGMALIQGVLQAILENVDDPITRNKIQGRIIQLVSQPTD